MVIRDQKSTCWGRLCRSEVKELLSSSSSLVATNGYSHQYRPMPRGGNKIAVNKYHIISYHIISYHITFWSAACQVRPTFLLYPAECGTGDNGP